SRPSVRRKLPAPARTWSRPTVAAYTSVGRAAGLFRAMSDFSRTLIERSGYESEDFADLYDRYRLAPPRELLDILTLVADAERPRLVVDLGAGTGLATRVWAERADRVIGVEPNAQMVERARRATQSNVDYVEAFAADTGLGGVEA